MRYENSKVCPKCGNIHSNVGRHANGKRCDKLMFLKTIRKIKRRQSK